jgi:hypothetical protein
MDYVNIERRGLSIDCATSGAFEKEKYGSYLKPADDFFSSWNFCSLQSPKQTLNASRKPGKLEAARILDRNTSLSSAVKIV